MDSWYSWYENLNKPSWTPSSSLIGTAWGLLYPIILVSFGYAVYLVFRDKLSAWILLPFGLNIIFNLAFTPLFMGQRNLPLALVDCILLLLSIVWIMIVIYPHSKGVFAAQIPYLLWVSVATSVMAALNWLNR